jgi:hypothetical protein
MVNSREDLQLLRLTKVISDKENTSIDWKRQGSREQGEQAPSLNIYF